MTEAVLEAPHKVTIREAPAPEPGAGEALLAPERVGICGSDMHAWHGLHPFITPPVVPGHEFSATVCSAPDGSGLSHGDRVTVEPNLICGVCRNCRAGRYNICDTLKVIGCQTPGAMADFLTVPVDKIIPLPEAMGLEEACLIEPLAVGIHALKRARFQPGESVLILGAGTIGLMCLQAAKAMGAGVKMITDLQDWRLERAQTLGAGATFRADDPDLRAAVRRVAGPDGADIILECVGYPAAMRAAVEASRKGGRIVVVGVHGEPVDLNVGLIQDWELDVYGSLMYTREDFEQALDLISRGRVETQSFITHRFPLEEAARAYETLDDPDARALKALIQVGGRA
jgi:L-iditol 2-dehydrogenase